MTCPGCHAALHCCRNCRFYSASAHNKCSEPSAEWVRDKEKANFCEFFTFGLRAVGEGKSDAGSVRTAFDDLFKK